MFKREEMPELKGARNNDFEAHMYNELMSFSADEQNEILRNLKAKVLEGRMQLVGKIKEELNFIEKSIEDLK